MFGNLCMGRPRSCWKRFGRENYWYSCLWTSFRQRSWKSSNKIDNYFFLKWFLFKNRFKKYKFWNPKVRLCIVIVLSCPLIDCWANERAYKRAAQNKLLIKGRTLGVPVFVILNFFTCKTNKKKPFIHQESENHI